jgi:hypothetical protein
VPATSGSLLSRQHPSPVEELAAEAVRSRAGSEGTTMDEFARLMSMEGVRPLDQPKEKSRQPASRPRQYQVKASWHRLTKRQVATRG